MSNSDSLLLFEIAVENLKSFTKCNEYNIRARFCDVFTLQLKDPNKVIEEVFKKSKLGLKAWPRKFSPPAKSVLVAMDYATLLMKMITKPIELCVFCSKDPCTLGLVEIPWTSVHTDYIRSLQNNGNPPPAILTDNYKAYDEYTSKRVANIRLRIKLSQLTGKIPSRPYTVQGNLGPAWNTMLNPENLDDDETVTGKTIYVGGKRKRKDQNGKLNSKMKIESGSRAADKTITTGSEAPTGLVEGLHVPTAASDFQTTKTGTLKPALSEQNVSTIISYSDDVCQQSSQRKAYNNCNGLGDGSTFDNIDNNLNKCRRIADLIRSETELDVSKHLSIAKHWSTTSLEIKQRIDTLNYIFGNMDGPFGNQVYCVGYFTVKSNASSDDKSPNAAQRQSLTSQQGKKDKQAENVEYSFQPCGESCKEEGLSSRNPCAHEPCDADLSNKDTFKMDICGPECRYSKKDNPCFEKICQLDIPADADPKVVTLKCDNVIECPDKYRPMYMYDPPLPTLLKLDNRSVKECCVEQKVIANVSAKMTHGDDPCLCTCDCTFGLVTHTTYCAVCGGYEVPGDEVVGQRGGPPFPCPIYHNLSKKGKGKKTEEVAASSERQTRVGASDRTSRGRRQPGSGSAPDDKQTSLNEPGKETGKKKVDERFKFNYGYKGIPPQIGHSQCVTPCTGDYSNVPKYMGWLWTADNIPGLKRRPGWKPGAANKHVVRMLRIARYPDTALNKKRRTTDGKKNKRDPKRPLLVVEKKDGEYFVNLETMKQYNKPRLLNQPAFEDKDPLVYKVGRTDEENVERAKRRARARRRLMREQRAFVQSAFHDMCKEICLKTYQQALALMPFAEDPLCPCYPLEQPPDKSDESHSCSCSDSERDSGSATDEDEWIIEFTPPNAYYNPIDKSKRISRADNGSQYSYLDYQVKLIDRFGNPVPRYFTLLNGKTECSDLGGFWSPDKNSPNRTWMKINEDGVVGPDGRWAPNSFIGPCGEVVEAEHGKFETTNGVWLLVGVDGFVDCTGKWRFYPQNKKPCREDPKQKVKTPAQMNVTAWLNAGGCKAKEEVEKKKRNIQAAYGVHTAPSENTWSCFGTASLKDLTKKGIVGHGRDRKLLLSTLEKMIKDGEDVKIPHIQHVPRMAHRKRPSPQAPRLSLVPARSQRQSLGIAAVSDHGHKTYLKLRESHTPRLKQRLKVLDDEGISLSSYHVPCFRSFINTEEERKINIEHILKHNARVMTNMGTQVD